MVESDEFVRLTFANPNYQKTSTETINLERTSSAESQEWKIFRYNKKDVSTVKSVSYLNLLKISSISSKPVIRRANYS